MHSVAPQLVHEIGLPLAVEATVLCGEMFLKESGLDRILDSRDERDPVLRFGCPHQWAAIFRGESELPHGIPFDRLCKGSHPSQIHLTTFQLAGQLRRMGFRIFLEEQLQCKQTDPQGIILRE